MGSPLPPDSPDSIEADLAAMHSDARQWEGCAEKMRGAAATVQGLTLAEADFSVFGTDVVVAYQGLQRWALGLLNGAHKNLDAMSDALHRSADEYEAQDAAEAWKLDKTFNGG